MSAPETSTETPVDERRYTPAMMEHLRRTRPWVLGLAIAGFMGGGLMVLLAFALAIPGVAVQGPGLIGVLFGGVFYGGIGLFGLLFAALLLRFALSIGGALKSGATQDVIDAIEAQRFFWKASGIATIAAIGLTMIVMVGFVIASVAMVSTTPL